MTYNYERFDDEVEAGHEVVEFATWAERNRVGAAAVSGILTRLDDGAQVELAQLWRRQHVVIEFGSFT